MLQLIVSYGQILCKPGVWSRTEHGPVKNGGRMSIPTMKDVARHARVSTATVSAVINQTSPVSAPLKERVLEAIGLLNYSPSGVARSLRTRSSRLIGLIIADITNPFFTQLVRFIGAAAQAVGYTVLLCETNHDPQQEAEALQLLAVHGVDGVILAPTGPAEMYFEPALRDFPRPIVIVDRVVPGLAFDTVSIDNHRAAFAVTRHILSFGHRRVAIIAGASHLANTAERLEGFREALATVGLEVDPADIVYADFREDRSHVLCRDLLARPDRPTALFVSNNQMVIGAMHAMRDLGLDCPADVSLAAIDELPGADALLAKADRTAPADCRDRQPCRPPASGTDEVRPCVRARMGDFADPPDRP